jgi:hypothetical protein
MSDRTILNPQYANSLNGLFNGTSDLNLNDVTADRVILKSQNTGSNYQLGCYNSLLSINTGDSTVTPEVQLTNGGGGESITLSVPTNNVLRMSALNLYNPSNGNNVSIEPIGDNMIGLINTSDNSNKGNIQAGTYFAINSIQSPIYNISGSSSNINVTYNNTAVEIPASLSVSGYTFSSAFTGGLYCDALTLSPPRTIQTSQSTQVQVNIPWYPSLNWTTDTICVMPTYISDYPLNTTAITLAQSGQGQLQIVFTILNSFGAASNLYAINYVVLNQA